MFDQRVVDDLRVEVANLAKVISSVVSLASAVMQVLGGGVPEQPPQGQSGPPSSSSASVEVMSGSRGSGRSSSSSSSVSPGSSALSVSGVQHIVAALQSLQEVLGRAGLGVGSVRAENGT